MSFWAMLALVSTAVFGLANLGLSVLIGAAWRLGLQRRGATSAQILALRLVPSIGALVLSAAVAVPAFLRTEPAHEAERVGACVIALGLLGFGVLGAGIARGWRAIASSRRLLRHCGHGDRRWVEEGRSVVLIDVTAPIVAVCGGWRPRIIASRRVFEACSAEEFRQVIAHEAAHLSTRDNLKLLMLISVPDALAWLPCSARICARWRAAAEFEADERAAGAEPSRRLSLASALIKVARLDDGSQGPLPALSMGVAADDVEGRVRRLLAPAAAGPRRFTGRALAAGVMLVPVLALPYYGLIHRAIEALVAFGR